MRSYLYIISAIFIIGVLSKCKTAQETTTPKSNKKEIEGPFVVYGVSNSTYSYDASTHAYTFTVPVSANIKSLKILFLVSDKATVSPDPNTFRDYTNPVVYTVTAEDGSKQDYTIRAVQQIPKSSAKQITEFSFESLNPAVSASIDQSKLSITATVALDVNVTGLVPTIKVSDKATVSPASGIAQNFTNAITYTVTAEDGSKQNYVVSVVKQATPVVPTGFGCLLTKIEAQDPSSYCIFIYDQKGRITSAAIYNLGLYTSNLSCSYDEATGYATNAVLQHVSSGKTEYKFSYTNNKLDMIYTKYVPTNSFGYFKTLLNSNNQVVQMKSTDATGLQLNGCIGFDYKEGSLIRKAECGVNGDIDLNAKAWAKYESSSTKSIVYNQKGDAAFLYLFGNFMDSFYSSTLPRDGNPFVDLLGYTLPSKTEYIGYATTPFSTSFIYGVGNSKFTNNNSNYPTIMNFAYTSDANTAFPVTKTFNFKFTYGGCQ